MLDSVYFAGVVSMSDSGEVEVTQDKAFEEKITAYFEAAKKKAAEQYTDLKPATAAEKEEFAKMCLKADPKGGLYSARHYLLQAKICKLFDTESGKGKSMEETGIYFLMLHILLAGTEVENTEQLKSVLPKNHVIPNNKLANTMTRGIIDVGEIKLEETGKNAKKLIETTCILSYEGDGNKVHLSGRQPFTEYDRNVYNAISSLYVYGDQSHIVTPAMVYRAMTGLQETEKPTDGQLSAVTNSIDKMRFIRVRIDCTEELKAWGVTLSSQQIDDGEIDTYLLNADAKKVRAGGQTVQAYQIIQPPILYEYAASVKQVLTVPASLLDVKDLNKDGSIGARLPNTETRILIKGYLLRRIEGMKGKNGLKNRTIKLGDYQRDGETHQGLYSIAGKPNADRKEMQRIRDNVEKMLAYWVKIGYINSFETQTERKKITGYEIII